MSFLNSHEHVLPPEPTTRNVPDDYEEIYIAIPTGLTPSSGAEYDEQDQVAVYIYLAAKASEKFLDDLHHPRL